MPPPARALADAVAEAHEHPERHEDDHEDRHRRERPGEKPEHEERQREAHEIEAVGGARVQALLGHDHAGDEVACGLAVRAGVAHALDPHLVAVVGVGRDVDDDLARRERSAGAAARLARVGHDLARALALRALHLHDADAEDAAEVDRDAPAPLAGRARLGVLGVDGACAVADVAGGVALVGHAAPAAGLGLLRVEVDLEDDVLAGARVVGAGFLAGGACVVAGAEGSPGEGAAREGVPVPAVAVAGRRTGRGAGEGVPGTHGVVALALIGVGEDRIGLGDLLEALLGVGLLVHVGMELAGLLLESLADLLGGRALGHAEDRVIVLVVHRGHVAGLLRLGKLVNSF